MTFPGSLKIGCNRAIEDSLTVFRDCTAFEWWRVCEAHSLAPSLLNLCQGTRKQSGGSCKLRGVLRRFENAGLTYFVVNLSVSKLSVCIKVFGDVTETVRVATAESVCVLPFPLAVHIDGLN